VIRRCLILSVLAVSSAGAAAEPAAKPAPEPAARELTVCADPNNLPFSNKAEEGFEIKIASLIARDMGPISLTCGGRSGAVMRAAR
jgi:hypothetical protein